MTRVPLEQKVLSDNDKAAAALRERFERHGTLCLNLIGSPGCGKTALLERTLAAMPAGVRAAVLTGDIQTDADARRLSKYGFPAKEITTAGACHLDARMVARSLEDWDIGEPDVLFVENVGNLVCPTSYDLGEHSKIVVLSVAEGEEKPLKYPGIFFKSDLMVLAKIDLLPYVDFDRDQAIANARSVNPKIEIVTVSAKTGSGIDEWIKWVEGRIRAAAGGSRAGKT
jgi:hydrogenase nickel incorporation protein HypB